jgi:FkbM family methyltransferase
MLSVSNKEDQGFNMSFKQKAMHSATQVLKMGIRVFGGRRDTLISAQLAEALAPTINQQTEFGTIKFFCPGKIPEWRAQTLLTKEPETIEWINTFNDKDILWDIGANVGVYTLYASLRNISVMSFEPSPSNYYLLNRNIEINNMSDKISALCIAFNDTTKLDSFYMANTELGSALNSFGEAIDWKGEPFTAYFKQAMIGFSIDDFIKQFNPRFPNHIKIDVDGIEDKIIKGAKHTLSDKRVKSVLVELDSNRENYCKEVIDSIEKSGMKFIEKKHAEMFDNSNFSASYNYIFKRPNL